MCIDEMEEESEEVIAVNQNQDESDEVCSYQYYINLVVW